MKVTADSKKRVVVPDARPGDVFDYVNQGNSRFLLVRLERPSKLKVKVLMEGNHLVLSRGQKITWAETRKAMDEFP